MIQVGADPLLAVADLIATMGEVLRPLEVITPAEFAQKHRVVVGGPFAGRWDNTTAPYLVDVMNAVQEAITEGKHLVCMKGAQEGVTEALGINAVMWLLTYYPGPVLYLTAKDGTAKKVSLNRWAPVLKTCALLREKHLSGKLHGEQILEKRFADGGALTLAGSRSMNNFISNPYAVVVFDELDACQDRQPDGADPVATIMERLTAFAEGRPVLVIAFAHPTTKERGVGKIYYRESDQRRGHVRCPKCGSWFAPLWRDHVRAFPALGQSPASAERDPHCYKLVASCCGEVLSNTDRLRMIERVEQRSTLPPEAARQKDWIGVHIWHLFLRRGGAIEALAKKHIAGIDEEGKRIPFVNKSCGDAVEVEGTENPDETAWKACITHPRFEGDRASYYRGEVPAEVQVLTAGTDLGLKMLHWTVWGWGRLPIQGGGTVLCGWLIDWGVVKRDSAAAEIQAEDLRPFDGLIYDRLWTTADGRDLIVREGGHDTGYQPNPVYEFAARRPGRSIPVKGDNATSSSPAPLLRYGRKPVRIVRDVAVKDTRSFLGVINTYLAKRMFFGRVRRRFPRSRGDGLPPEIDRWRLHLPLDVEDEMIRHLASERLVREKRELKWEAQGPNHWSDCSVYAFALAESLAETEAKDEVAEPEPGDEDEDDEEAEARESVGRAGRPAPIRRRY